MNNPSEQFTSSTQNNSNTNNELELPLIEEVIINSISGNEISEITPVTDGVVYSPSTFDDVGDSVLLFNNEVIGKQTLCVPFDFVNAKKALSMVFNEDLVYGILENSRELGICELMDIISGDKLCTSSDLEVIKNKVIDIFKSRHSLKKNRLRLLRNKCKFVVVISDQKHGSGNITCSFTTSTNMDLRSFRHNELRNLALPFDPIEGLKFIMYGPEPLIDASYKHKQRMLDSKGRRTIRKEYNSMGRAYVVKPIDTPVAVICDDLIDSRVLTSYKKHTDEDISNFLRFCGYYEDVDIEKPRHRLIVSIDITTSGITFTNMKSILAEIRPIMRDANLIISFRYDWVCSFAESNSATHVLVLRLYDQFYTLLYNKTPITGYQNMAPNMWFWTYIASMSYDFPQFSAEELSVIEPHAAFLQLLISGDEVTLWHLLFTMNMFEVSFICENIGLQVDAVDSPQIIDSGLNTVLKNFKFKRAVTFTASHYKWKPLVMGVLFVLFTKIPQASAVEVTNGQKQESQWYVVLTIVIFLFKSIYDLFRARKEIATTVKEIFDIESPFTPLEKQLKVIKKRDIYRSEMGLNVGTLTGDLRLSVDLLCTACGVMLKSLKLTESLVIDAVFIPLGIKDKNLRIFMGRISVAVLFTLLRAHYAKKNDTASLRRLKIVSSVWFITSFTRVKRGAIYVGEGDAADNLYEYGIYYNTDSGEFSYGVDANRQTPVVTTHNFSSESMIDVVQDMFNKVNCFKHSNVGKSLKYIVEATVSSCLDYDTKLNLDAFWNSADLFENLANVFIHVGKAVVALNSGVPAAEVLNIFLDQGSDNEFLACKRIADGVASGNFIKEGHSPQVTLLRFTSLLESYKEREKTSSRREYTYLLNRIILIQEWIDELVAKEIQGKPKMQPFVVTLYGGPGIGKSYAIENLAKFLHCNHKKFSGEDYPERLGFMNPDDKYDSNLDSSTTCIVMNDIGVVKHEKRETPVMTLLKRMCDSIIEPFVKADVTSKGKCFNMSKLIIITTNSPDGGTGPEATNPGAAARRLGIKLHMELKEEYSIDGSPDMSKLHSLEGMLPEHCTYTAYDLRGDPTVKIPLTEPMSAGDAMIYIQSKLRDHVDHYISTRSESKDSPLCGKCGLPTKICGCSNYESEGLISTFSNVLTTYEQMAFSFYSSIRYYTGWFADLLVKSKWLYSFTLLTISCLLLTTLSLVIHIREDLRMVCVNTTITETWLVNSVPLIVENGYVEECDRNVTIHTYINLVLSFVSLFLVFVFIKIAMLLKTVINLKGRRIILDRFSTLVSSISWNNFLYASAPIALVTIYSLIRMRKTIAPSLKKTVHLMSEQGILSMFGLPDVAEMNETLDSMNVNTFTVAERKEMIGQELPWTQVVRGYPIPGTKARGATIHQLTSLIKRNTVKINWFTSKGIGVVHGLFIETGVFIAPLHAIDSIRSGDKRLVLSYGLQKCEVILSDLNIVEDVSNDLCIISTNAMGSRKNLMKYLSNKPFVGSGQAIWIRASYDKEDNVANFEDMVIIPVVIKSEIFSASLAKNQNIDGYTYSAETYNGACGSVLLVDGPDGPAIIGFHVAGTGTQGAASKLILSNITDSLGKLREKCPSFIRGTEKDRVDTDLADVKVSDEPHPRNPINYIPFMGGNTLQFFGDVGTDFTPSASVMPSMYKDVAKKYFPVPDLVPRNLKARTPKQELLINGTAIMPNIDLNILDKAVKDYINLDSLRQLMKEAENEGILVLGRFYTEDEVLNGIEGHPYRHAIKASTSAGWPYNKAKNKVLLGDSDNGWKLKRKDADTLYEIFHDIMQGQHSGLPYKCSLKDEGCEIAKVDRPRLFQAGNMLGLILQMMIFGPAIDFMTAHPNFFEIAVGVNPHDVTWHKSVASVFKRFKYGFEFDYSKYDQTQHPSIKAGVGKVIATLTKEICGLPDAIMPCIDRLCSEFTLPLINFFGSMVEIPNLMPSGTFTTAHGNCIYNSLMLRMSVFTAVPEIDQFRAHVAMVCLGDDNGGSFDDIVLSKWNQKVFTAYANSIGMLVTDGTKTEVEQEYVDNTEISFLSRKTVYCPRRKCCVGLLKTASMFKSLAVTNPSKVSQIQQLSDVIRAIVIESYNCNDDVAIEYYHNFVHFADEVNIAFPPEAKHPLLVEWTNYDLENIGFPTRVIVYNSESGEMPQVDKSITDHSELVGVTTTQETVNDSEHTTPAAVKSVIYGELAHYLDREYLVDEERFNPGGVESVFFNPYWNLLKHKVLSGKLDNIALMRAGLCLRFVCSATSMHSGSFLLSWSPSQLLVDFQNESGMSPSFARLTMSSRQSVVLRIGTEDTEAKLTVPYIFWDPYINPRDDYTVSHLGRCNILTISPITHALNNTVPVLIRVYAKLVDYSFSGATAFLSEGFPEERFSSKVSVLANMAGKAEEIFSITSPELAVPAGIAKNTLNGISGAARLFGHSRPLNIPSSGVIPYLTGNMSVTNSNLPAHTLALDVDQGVTISSLVGGSNANDTLTHDFLLKKKVLVGVFPVTGDMGSNTVIFDCGVTPAFSLREGRASILTPQGIVASQYNLWCGTVHYEVVVSRNQMTGGKLILFHDPYGAANNTLETNKSLLFDIRDTTHVSADIGWSVPDLMLRTNSSTLYEPLAEHHIKGYTNGSLSLRVHSPITGSGTSTPVIYVELYVWCSEDTVFADHVNYLGRYTVSDSGDLLGGDGRQVSKQPSVPLSVVDLLPGNLLPRLRDDALFIFDRRVVRDDPLVDWLNKDPDTIDKSLSTLAAMCCDPNEDNVDPPSSTQPSLAPSVMPSVQFESNKPSLLSSTNIPTLLTTAPTIEYPPDTEPPDNTTSTPSNEIPSDNVSSAPSTGGLWKSLFPSMTSTDTQNPVNDINSLPSTGPSQAPKKITRVPSAKPSGRSLPSASPSASSSAAPSVSFKPCEAKVVTASPWFLGSDGYVELLEGKQVLDLNGAVNLHIPSFTDTYGNIRGQRTVLKFTGSLVIDGTAYTNSYTVPLMAGQTFFSHNVTGSTAVITDLKVTIPENYIIREFDLAELTSYYYTSESWRQYSSVQVQTRNGAVMDGIKLGAQQNSTYRENVQINNTIPGNCGGMEWASIIFEGTSALERNGTYRGLSYAPMPREYPVAYGAPNTKSQVYFTTPTTMVVIRAFALIGAPSFVSEGYLTGSSEPTAHLKVGVSPDTTAVLAICAGERMNSLRSLMQIPKPTGMYEIGQTSYQFSKPIYAFGGAGTNITQLMLLAHLGVRGGVINHVRLIGDGQLILYRPVAKDMPADSMFSRGYEVLDTRVNPAISARFPYYNQSYFYMPRTTNQPGLSSYPERGYRVYKTSQSSLYISETSSIAEDFCLIQFLGCPILYRS